MIAAARSRLCREKIILLDEPGLRPSVREETLAGEVHYRAHRRSFITSGSDVLAIARTSSARAGGRQDVLDVASCTLDDIVNLIIRGRSGETTPGTNPQS
jgi:hypothetical protein